jgi:hypothetical protein
MNDQGVEKTLYYWKTRKLADGTERRYRSKKTYKIKGGVNDQRKNRPKHDTLTIEQKGEVAVKYDAGVKIKRICEDLGVSYAVIRRVIDAHKQCKNEGSVK